CIPRSARLDAAGHAVDGRPQAFSRRQRSADGAISANRGRGDTHRAASAGAGRAGAGRIGRLAHLSAEREGGMGRLARRSAKREGGSAERGGGMGGRSESFGEFVARKEAEAARAVLSPFATEVNQPPADVIPVGNAWTRQMFDGPFYVSAAS